MVVGRFCCVLRDISQGVATADPWQMPA